MRILLVEDEERIASFLERGLGRGGHVVDVMLEGLPAVRALSDPACAYEAVVLDLGLPDVDGLEVLRLLREQGVWIPVVVVTARSADEEERKALALGVVSYLHKPFPLSRLLESLENVAA